MTIPRRAPDGGSARIVLVVFVSILAVGTVAVVQAPLLSTKRAQGLSAAERTSNALDGALAAAAERLRLDDSAPACTNFVLRDVDDAATHRPPARPINVHVRCEASGETFRLVATGYQFQPDCDPDTGLRSMTPVLEAAVSFPAVGVRRTTEVAERRLVAEAERCLLEPGTSPFDE